MNDTFKREMNTFVLKEKTIFFLFHSYQQTYFTGVGTSDNEMKRSTNRPTGSEFEFTLMCVSLTWHVLKE